jgi:hypothetical protein
MTKILIDKIIYVATIKAKETFIIYSNIGGGGEKTSFNKIGIVILIMILLF